MRAVSYSRQSVDHAEGAADQERRARRMIDDRGWAFAGAYVDNDVSATRARDRGTAWARLVADIKAGAVDVVVVTDTDRLARGLRDALDLVDLGTRLLTLDGDIDLTTAAGERQFLSDAVAARFEVRRKSERSKRGNERRALAGTYKNGARPFGWLEDRVSLDPDEAPLVAAAARRILDGASLHSIATDWNRRGIPTRRGAKAWSTPAVRAILLRPRNAGHVVLRGEVVEGVTGDWAPILEDAEWRQVVAILTDPARRTNAGAKARHLLGGLIQCGTCGGPMRSNAIDARKGVRVPGYRCTGRPERPADGLTHAAVPAAEVDERAPLWVLGALADRAGAHLDTADEPREVAALLAERSDLNAQYERLTDAIADGTLDAARVAPRTRRIRERVRQIDAEIEEAGLDRARRGAMAAAARMVSLDDLLTHEDGEHEAEVAATFLEHWRSIDLEEQRELIAGTLIITANPRAAVRKGAKRITVRYTHNTAGGTE